jgi:(p)ppGpp synthase/HD superfamily hydrolase
MLDEMLVLATNAHHRQMDKAGKPYILHCLKVMHYLKSDDEELMCIALGHDLVEDTYVTSRQLLDLGFSDRVVDGILNLTKRKGQSYDDYKHQVMSSRDAMLVKLCDLRHNSDIRRLKGVTDKDVARVVKYHTFYLEIKEKLGE